MSTLPITAGSRPRKILTTVRPSALKAVAAREAEMLQDVRSALEDANLKHTAAAEIMGISESQLSRQLVGQEHLSARRLGLLPPAFQAALIKRRALRFNLHVQDAQRRRERFAEAQQLLLRIMEAEG